jgi:hypothetical protein
MGGSARKAARCISCCRVLEIRDTWLRFSNLEILKNKDGLPRNTEKLLLVSKMSIKIRSLAPGGGESRIRDGGD